MSFLFRPNRRTLHESLKEVVELEDKEALVSYIKDVWAKYPSCEYDINYNTISIEPYGYDDRIGWNTFVVQYKKGDYSHVEGFTNGHVFHNSVRGFIDQFAKMTKAEQQELLARLNGK